MRQEKGTKLKSYAGVYRLSDGTFRIVAKAVDPKTGKPKFKERFTREVDPQMPQNAAIAYRAQLINEIKPGTSGGTISRSAEDLGRRTELVTHLPNKRFMRTPPRSAAIN